MMKKFNYSKFIYLPYIILALVFIYGPIASLVVFSFNSGNSAVVWREFSFVWYEKLFTDSNLMDAITNSIIIAVVATIISIIIGFFASLSLDKMSKKRKKMILQINNIPIVSPEIIIAISLFLLFGSIGVTKGLTTVILAHISFCTPYVIVTLLPRLERLDPNLWEAAADLGATPSKIIRKIIFPQLIPAIISAAAIAFTMSFDDFIISYFTRSGSGINTISTYVYTLKRFNGSINAFSTIIIVLLAVGITINQIIHIKKLQKEKI